MCVRGKKKKKKKTRQQQRTPAAPDEPMNLPSPPAKATPPPVAAVARDGSCARRRPVFTKDEFVKSVAKAAALGPDADVAVSAAAPPARTRAAAAAAARTVKKEGIWGWVCGRVWEGRTRFFFVSLV